MNYAIQNFGINADKATVITYGITWNNPPSMTDRETSKNKIAITHKLKDDEKIILFNGAFDYKPNIDALYNIINEINPALQRADNFKYKILICGRDIPGDVTNTTYPDIIFAGFVNDIEVYYKADYIFINPVNDGGSIKTKLVEALGYNITSVSTENGAIGVDAAICNGKLLITPNEDWNKFASEVIEASAIQTSVQQEYYNHFYWGKIIEKAINIIEQHA